MESSIIKSRQNSLIKQIISLRKGKYREKYSKYTVEGIKMVDEAVSLGITDDVIISEEYYNKNIEKYIKPAVVENRLFKTISIAVTPQGVMAIVNKNKSYNNIKDIIDGLIIIQDGIQDSGNAGTIIRTAEAAGAAAVIMLEGSADAYSPKTVQSTMGSIFRMPVYKMNIDELAEFKQSGWILYGGDMKGQDIYSVDSFPKKTALVIGSEGNGIREKVLELLDRKITIPMTGKSESLNVSIAAGIMMYHIQNIKHIFN